MHNQSSIIFVVIFILVIIFLIWAAWAASNQNNQMTKKLLGKSGDSNFRQSMNQLWNQHVALTRLVVTDAADNAPCLSSDLELLHQNQRDLGENLASKLGRSAGNKYGSLLIEHIDGAVKIVTLALQKKDITDAVKDWYANKDEIVAFLRSEVKGFDKKKLNNHWTEHLDVTLEEAKAIINHDCSASSKAYTEAVGYVNMMSDYMADTINKDDHSVALN